MDEKELIDVVQKGPDFELQLAKNVYWVPYYSLAEPQYSIKELKKLKYISPEEKKTQIHNISDAISLFILSDFTYCDDVIYLEEDGIQWEYHKPGELAVLSNNGCCASCASWLNYILEGDFESMGYLNLIRPSGGHVINFFYHDNWFYLLDLQPFTRSWRESICPQTGKRIDFMKSRFITGIMVKAKTLQDYINFHSRYTSKVISEHLYLSQTSNIILPLGIKPKVSLQHHFLPNTPKLCVFNTSLNQISYEFVPMPKKTTENVFLLTP